MHMTLTETKAASAPPPPVQTKGFQRPECWYVVEAFEHSVAQARLNLAVAGLHVWAPMDVRRQANRSRSSLPRRDVRTPRFGRYLFVRCTLTDALRNAIDNTPAVAGLLVACKGDEPQPIPDHVIEWLREPPPAVCEGVGFVVGDLVRITDGPFIGFEAKVDDLDKRGAIELAVDVFGRPTPIVIPVGHVEMVQPAKSRAILGVKSHRAAKAAPVRKLS